MTDDAESNTIFLNPKDSVFSKGAGVGMRLRGERQFQTVVCAVLLKLAKALNKTISYLVDEKEPSREIELVKRKDRKKLYSSRVHVWIENLAGSMEDGFLTGIFCVIEPKANSGKTKMSHRGEQMIVVLDNVIEFTIRNKIYPLSKGDCLHFRTEVPHSWKNPTNRKTKTFWVFAPAPFLL